MNMITSSNFTVEFPQANANNIDMKSNTLEKKLQKFESDYFLMKESLQDLIAEKIEELGVYASCKKTNTPKTICKIHKNQKVQDFDALLRVGKKLISH